MNGIMNRMNQLNLNVFDEKFINENIIEHINDCEEDEIRIDEFYLIEKTNITFQIVTFFGDLEESKEYIKLFVIPFICQKLNGQMIGFESRVINNINTHRITIKKTPFYGF